MGLLVLAQNPATKLLSEIKSNSCIKLCFQVGGDEIYRMSQIMGLNREQMEELFHLKEGEAICRVGLGYTEPVLLEIHNVPREHIDDYELAEMMKPTWDELLSDIELARPEQTNLFKGGIHAPAKAGAEVKSVDVIKDESEVSMEEQSAVKETQIEVSEDELAYMRIMGNFPWRLIGEIYGLLGSKEAMGEGTMGLNKAGRIRKKLVKKKYIQTFAVKGTGKSGRSECDVLTEKAIEETGLKMAYKPRGDNLHGFWCYRVSEYYLRQGAEVSMGETFDGNEMDVAVRMDGRTIGVEVVVTELVVDNLPKHLSWYDEVRVLCIDEEKKKEVERGISGLDSEIQEKVKIELLKDYFISL